MEVAKLDAPLGAEIKGVDLTAPLSTDQVKALEEALLEHHLLLFRGQDLSEEQQLAFTQAFGELEKFPEADKTKSAPQIYNVANVSRDGEHLPEDDPRVIFQKVNARWHTDSSWRYIPSIASVMFGVEVLPPEAEGGETEFSNVVMAYEALSEADKELIEPLHMVHTHEFGRRLFPSMPPLAPEVREQIPPVSQPLVRVHPERNWCRSLFITANSGNEVSGMTLEEGQALHARLMAHAEQERFCYLHRWEQNDLVMWDNRTLLHRARPYDMAKYRRAFRRTTVAGVRPVVGPFSNEVRRAEALRAHPIIAKIRGMIANRGADLYGGEVVTQEQHALQCAQLAEDHGASKTLITAALLHDVGHLIEDDFERDKERGVDTRHEEISADFLERYFGPMVTNPVRLHVAAKRYLCATDESYFSRLSPTSVRTLELQGGPMSEDEQREFEKIEGWQDALKLRRWDDMAKAPEKQTKSPEHFLAIAATCLR